jgi:hypothetical protein
MDVLVKRLARQRPAFRHAAERAVIMADGTAIAWRTFHAIEAGGRRPVDKSAASISISWRTDDRAALRMHHFNISPPPPSLDSAAARYRRTKAWALDAVSNSAWRGACWSDRGICLPRRRLGHRFVGRPLVAAFIAFAAVASIWQFIRKTNFQVALHQVRSFGDYSQRFSDPSGGGSTCWATPRRQLKMLQVRHASCDHRSSLPRCDRRRSSSALLSVDEDGRVSY